MWALQSGGAGKTSVLTYTMPFWLLLLAWAFLGERLRGVQWLAVALALAGLVLVLSPWRLQGVFSSALAVAGGLSPGRPAPSSVKLLQRRHEVDVLSLTTWQMLFGSMPLIDHRGAHLQGRAGVAGAVHLGAGLQRHPGERPRLVPLAVRAPRRCRPAPRASARWPSPVIGVAAAWLQLGERPTAGEAAGMALIIGALAIVTVRGALDQRR